MEGPYQATVTRIPVHLTERISSQDARAGDTFGFDTSSSAEVDGQFLPANTHGHGVVLKAQAAKGPKPGVLVLQAQTLDVPGEKQLTVGLDAGQLDRSIDGDVRTYPPETRNGTAGNVPFNIGGSRGTNIVYEKGTAFVVVWPAPPTPEPEPKSEQTG
jgi:hypothetical protein